MESAPQANHSGIVLIAGATGYLGRYLVNAYAEAGYAVRALVRSPERFVQPNGKSVDVVVAEITDPKSLQGCCNGVDLVVSAVGITRQKDGLGYADVDYQANRNLLDEAIRAGVDRFAYIHVLNAERMPEVAMAAAKARFAAELDAAPINATVICPSGFFSDLTEILHMARHGRVYLFGSGQSRLSPIHGADLAALCVEATARGRGWVQAGGPETLTQNDIAQLAFTALGQPSRITRVPLWAGRAFVKLAKLVGLSAAVGPIEFFLAASALDMSAPPHGTHCLLDAFRAVTVSPG